MKYSTLFLVLLTACGPVYTVEDEAPDAAPPAPVPPGEIALDTESLAFFDAFLDCPSVALGVGMSNVGEGPLNVGYVSLEGDDEEAFELVWLEEDLEPGDEAFAYVSFVPSEDRDHQAVLRIRSDDPEQDFVDVELTGTVAPDPYVTDTLYQVDAEPIDLLFVIDKTATMSSMLEDVADQFAVLGDLFALGDVDWRVATVFADMGPGHSGAITGEIITADTVDPGAVFQANVAVPVSPDGRGFDVIEAALSEPMASTVNAGFPRADANLVTVVYSDRDDQSAFNGLEFAPVFDGLTDPVTDSLVAATGPDSGLLPCNVLFGFTANPAPQYHRASQDTGGVHLNLCNLSAQQQLTELATHASGLQTSFPLDHEVSDPMTFTVTVDGADVAWGDVDGWTYDEVANAIVFHGVSLPFFGAEIEIDYQAHAVCD